MSWGKLGKIMGLKKEEPKGVTERSPVTMRSEESAPVERRPRSLPDQKENNQENLQNFKSVRGKNEACLLVSAAKDGDMKTVKSLLKSGTSVEQHDTKGNTGLMEAAASGRLEVVRVLLESGATTQATNTGGETALHLAAVMGHAAVTKVLVARGAELEAQTRRGTTPMHNAAKKGREEVVRELARAGANVNSQDGELLTPLHHASMYNKMATVVALIQLGAVHILKSKLGMTALMLARQEGHEEVVLLLTGLRDMMWKKEDRLALEEAKKKGPQELVQLINSKTEAVRPSIVTSVSSPDLSRLSSRDGTVLRSRSQRTPCKGAKRTNPHRKSASCLALPDEY